MGLLSLSNLAICIKKAEFSGFKSLKNDFKGEVVSKIQFTVKSRVLTRLV